MWLIKRAVIVSKDMYDCVNAKDEAELDMDKGIITVNDKQFPCTKLPEYMQNILNAGGLISFLNAD